MAVTFKTAKQYKTPKDPEIAESSDHIVELRYCEWVLWGYEKGSTMHCDPAEAKIHYGKGVEDFFVIPFELPDIREHPTSTRTAYVGKRVTGWCARIWIGGEPITGWGKPAKTQEKAFNHWLNPIYGKRETDAITGWFDATGLRFGLLAA